MSLLVCPTSGRLSWGFGVVLSGLGAGFSRAEAAPLKFEGLHREIENLVYEFDCVSGARSACSLEAYQPLWETKFLISDDDRAALPTCGVTRARAGGCTVTIGHAPVPAAAPE